MRRRALLASLAAGAAGLAGCPQGAPQTTDGNGDQSPDGSGPDSSGSGPGSNGPTTDPPTATERPAETDRAGGSDSPGGTDGSAPPENRASVVELETGPRTYALAPTRLHTDDRADVALWFERTATADHPATLTGYVENGNDFENTFRVEWIPGVGRTHARQPDGYDHEARLHLAPTADNELAETVPELTRTDEGYWRVADVGPWMAETVRLDPGERRELAYAVVGEPDMPGRPTGTYEFRGDDRTVTLTAWDSNSPGPEEESRFADRSVPDFDREATAAWYHEADRTTEAFVRPSAERVELDGRVAFELVNNSREELGCGHWDLHKLVDGEWFHVDPVVHTSDCRILAPGGRKSWSLRAFNGEAVGCGGCGGGGGGCSGGLTRGYLGGGTYAVVAGYGHPADESAALVELVGDAADVVPARGVEHERDGDIVTVTTDRYGDDERPPDAAFALERTEAADERVIAEQVMRSGGITGSGGLRNALPFVGDGVARVVVRTDEHGVDRVLGYDADVRYVQYRGRNYEVSRKGSE